MIPGWFPPGNAAILSDLIDRFDVRTVIEVGCFVGKATVWFADRVDRVVAVDTFDAATSCAGYLRGVEVTAAQDQLGNFRRNIAGRSNVMTVVAPSIVAAESGLTADLVYLDADHSYEAVAADIAAWAPRARVVLCGDDYTRNWPGVRRAVDEMGGANTAGRVWWRWMHGPS